MPATQSMDTTRPTDQRRMQRITAASRITRAASRPSARMVIGYLCRPARGEARRVTGECSSAKRRTQGIQAFNYSSLVPLVQGRSRGGAAAGAKKALGPLLCGRLAFPTAGNRSLLLINDLIMSSALGESHWVAPVDAVTTLPSLLTRMFVGTLSTPSS